MNAKFRIAYAFTMLFGVELAACAVVIARDGWVSGLCRLPFLFITFAFAITYHRRAVLLGRLK